MHTIIFGTESNKIISFGQSILEKDWVILLRSGMTIDENALLIFTCSNYFRYHYSHLEKFILTHILFIHKSCAYLVKCHCSICLYVIRYGHLNNAKHVIFMYIAHHAGLVPLWFAAKTNSRYWEEWKIIFKRYPECAIISSFIINLWFGFFCPKTAIITPISLPFHLSIRVTNLHQFDFLSSDCYYFYIK